MKLDYKNINSYKKERISILVIEVLYARFKKSLDIEGKDLFPLLFKHSFNADCINMECWFHGLKPEIGQSFFESVAHILCDGCKEDFKGKNIYTNQLNAISDIMIDLKNSTEQPNLTRENGIIDNARNGNIQTALEFTADCLYETDTEVVAIELKSVRPNSGEMRGEKQKILQAKAVLKELYPNKEIKYYFGFPFDPTSSTDTGYDKTRFINYLVEASKFIDPSEMLLADELWSFLLGVSSGVMSELLTIINTIATPQFMEKYETIQNKSVGYENVLNEWFLESECFIFNNSARIPNSYKRIARQTIFKPDGSYRERRFELYSYLKANP